MHGYHPPEEEYLSTIREMQEDGIAVIQARLAERLGYAAPSVSAMLKRLEQAGLLTIGEGRAIELTEGGRKRAESVVRRHRLAERLLTDILGLEWHMVHEEASRWEHVISEAVEARLIDVLGRPATCPHGNPIPGLGSPRNDLIPLSRAHSGDKVTIERITETIEVDLDLVRFLDENGVKPGTPFAITQVSPDGTLVLRSDGTTVAIGAEISENLYVSIS